MGHNVEINDSLYESIKEYCSVNGEKVNVFVNRLIKKYLPTEQYGEVPSVIKKTSEEPPVITPVNWDKNEMAEQQPIIQETPTTIEKQEEKIIEVPSSVIITTSTTTPVVNKKRRLK